MKEPIYKDGKRPGNGVKVAGGGVAAGGIGLAKAGFLGKFLFWIFAWNGIRTAYVIGGWFAIALVAAAVVGWIVYRNREQA